MGEKGLKGEDRSRTAFFNGLYRDADGDADRIPWADLAPKERIAEWLARNPASAHESALDIACGLGDNAEALAAAGYATTAFDLSPEAIEWAKRRFPESGVDYSQADLFALPAHWRDAFDLVNECYTLQSLPPDMLDATSRAIASTVRPGGLLLVYARWRPDGAEASGPPWPLERRNLRVFQSLGFTAVHEDLFAIHKPRRVIPHAFTVWRRLKNHAESVSPRESGEGD